MAQEGAEATGGKFQQKLHLSNKQAEITPVDVAKLARAVEQTAAIWTTQGRVPDCKGREV